MPTAVLQNNHSIMSRLWGVIFGCSVPSLRIRNIIYQYWNSSRWSDYWIRNVLVADLHPDNIGCFFPQVVLPTCFSLSVVSPVVMLRHPASKCAHVCVRTIRGCVFKEACFRSARCLCLSFYYLYKLWAANWNVKSHISEELRENRRLHFLCVTAELCIIHLSGLFTQPH